MTKTVQFHLPLGDVNAILTGLQAQGQAIANAIQTLRTQVETHFAGEAAAVAAAEHAAVAAAAVKAKADKAAAKAQLPAKALPENAQGPSGALD